MSYDQANQECVLVCQLALLATTIATIQVIHVDPFGSKMVVQEGIVLLVLVIAAGEPL